MADQTDKAAAASDANASGQPTTGAEPRAGQPPPAAPAGTPAPGGQAAPAGGQEGGQQADPTKAPAYAVFPTAEDLNERLERARRQGMGQLLQELGAEDAEALKALVAAAKAAEEAGKSELEKLQGRLTEAQKGTQTVAAEREQLAAQLKAEREDRLVERLAGGLGFADATDAVSLVERARFQYSDEGQLSADSVKAALEALLESKPHLRGQAQRAPAIDAQAGTGKGPAAPEPRKDYGRLLPAALKRRGGAQPIKQ